MKYLLFLLLYCASSTTHAQVIVTVAGSEGFGGYSGDGGPATNAKLNSPYALAIDKYGKLYVSDQAVPVVRKVDTAGIITTFAGNGVEGYCCDGGPAISASISFINAIAADEMGNVYLVDGGNNRIRKVTPDGIIHTIAGTGVPGYNGDGIPATDAQLNGPESISVDELGIIYIADRNNYRIRKIDLSGNISTVAGIGTSGFSSDGSKADTARIDECYCLEVSKDGCLYFKDKNRVRKVTIATGLITTLAGNGTYGYSGDGGSAIVASISTEKFAIDSANNLIMGEGPSDRIRKVNGEGIISTTVGSGLHGYSPDGTAALVAALGYPMGIAINKVGEVFFAEAGTHSVRKITDHWAGVVATAGGQNILEVFPNPVDNNSFSIRNNGVQAGATITVTDRAGRLMGRYEVAAGQTKTITACWQAGVYMISADVAGKIYTQALVVK